MIDCKGPCLFHCYNKNTILFSLIGFILGYLTYFIIISQNKKHKTKLHFVKPYHNTNN